MPRVLIMVFSYQVSVPSIWYYQMRYRSTMWNGHLARVAQCGMGILPV
ncbi:hypothetical protein [Moorena sp. SIOASIH]|nr:hypothetical protein [Moorena sp. SIOASIH]